MMSPYTRSSTVRSTLVALALLLTACTETGTIVQVTISPPQATLAPSEAAEFTSTVTETENRSVSWSVTGGTFSGDGATVTYTAPVTPGTYTLTSTSDADPSKSASASIEVVSGGTPGPTPVPTPEPAEWCSQIQLAATAASPGDQVGITGLPANMDAVSADIVIPDTEMKTPAVILKITGQNAPHALLVPFHPTAPYTGGQVNLQFGNGSETCNPRTLEIKSLGNPNDPAIHGSFERSAVALQQAINQRASDMGVNSAALKGSFANLPTEATGLAVAQFLVDHPQNENALTAIASRGTVLTDGKYVDIEVGILDLLSHKYGLVEKVNESANVHPSATATECFGSLTDGPTLDDCMKLGAKLSEKTDFVEFLEPFLDMLSIATLIVPGSPLAMTTVIVTSTVVAYAAETSMGIAAKLIPTTIQSISFVASPTTFDTETQTGSWREVKVQPKDGEAIDVKEEVLNFVDLAIDLALEKILQRMVGSEVIFDHVDKVLEAGISGAKKEVINSLNKLTRELGLKTQIAPKKFPAVDITDFDESYTSTVRGGDVIRITSHEGHAYEPVVPLVDGSANLALQLQSGYFNNARSLASVPIEVAVGTITITKVSWPENITVSFKTEGALTFPLTLIIKTTNCSMTGGCASGARIPIANGVSEVFVSNPCLGESGTVSADFTIEDAGGISSETVNATSDYCTGSNSAPNKLRELGIQ